MTLNLHFSCLYLCTDSLRHFHTHPDPTRLHHLIAFSWCRSTAPKCSLFCDGGPTSCETAGECCGEGYILCDSTDLISVTIEHTSGGFHSDLYRCAKINSYTPSGECGKASPPTAAPTLFPTRRTRSPTEAPSHGPTEASPPSAAPTLLPTRRSRRPTLTPSYSATDAPMASTSAPSIAAYPTEGVVAGGVEGIGGNQDPEESDDDDDHWE
jgi:hypothetical protein